MSKKLRVGLLLDSFDVPAWIWITIREIAASDYAEFVLVVLNDTANRQTQRTGTPRRFSYLIRQGFWILDEWIGRRVPVEEDAFIPRDARDQLTGVPVYRVRPLQHRYSDMLAPDDVATLRGMNLDVLLQFGFRVLRGEILTVASCGVWSFHHGDNRLNRGGPAGFWEVHENWPVTGATLQMLTEDLDGGPVLARTSTSTVRTSIKRNRNSLYWKALPLLPRTLQRLHLEGEARFLKSVARTNAAPCFYSRRLFRTPAAKDLITHVFRRGSRLLNLIINKALKRQQWVLLCGMADDLITSCWRLRPLIPPPDRFWADPHVLKRGDKYFVFVEEYLFSTRKGHIAVLEIDDHGRASSARKVLEERYHLAYPFVFEHNGEIFMVPESAENMTIDLYRATSFPDKWELVEHLLTEVYAVDSTLVCDAGKWWLFANITQHRGAGSGELFLFSSDQLISGDWRRHPMNPLANDICNSRPAGAILRRNGRLYRPAQDSSIIYGYGIRLNEIVEISDNTYRENEIAFLEPKWDARIVGTHTLAHTGRLTVLDALRPRWKWSFNKRE